MSAKATITERGAVLLGKHVACDAYDETKPLRVVTHAHADHMIGLQQSLTRCERVLMTRATRDLIEALTEASPHRKGLVETLEYGAARQFGEEELTFFPANHILGATQVLVEDGEARIGYTGDFKIEHSPVLEADILVMEATYGNPRCTRPFKKDVEETLISLVETGLKCGPVYVFGYHGKLQEVMQILREANIKAPFVASERVFLISKVCEHHGVNVGRLLLTDETEGKELLETSSSCVAFHHMNSKAKVGNNALHITVSGWEFSFPRRQTGNNEYTIALSDHSDFDELIEYVRLAKPKLVITDGYRDGHAEAFAKEIRKRFAIPAVALPKR
jgi:putative mRNA 3-end processing factor